MSLGAAAANAGLAAGCAPSALALRRALRDPAREQTAILTRILRANAGTAFGRAHGFASVRKPVEFAAAVPAASWDERAEWVARVAAGEAGVLTAEPVELLEPTGGSSGATKLVPVTRSSRAEFRRGVAPWLADVFAAHPRALAGSAYWSVSPVGERAACTTGGVPIGFAGDEEYVGGRLAAFARASMAAPPALAGMTSMRAFRYVTLLHLLRRRDLAIVSVWNPTFMTLLLEELAHAGAALAADIAAGTCTLEGADARDRALAARLAARMRPDPVRAREVAAAFAEPDAPARHVALWPRLALLSCWADVHAAAPAAALALQLPQARLQPKGLLATEAFVSLPMAGAAAGVPAVRSHYLEFEPEAGGEAVGVHALERGRRYGVVVTTSGGLYRYRLGDLVEAGAAFLGCPTLRFVGRADAVSDRFGEKLHEAHVRRCIAAATTASGVAASFAMLAFDPGARSYVLYVDADDIAADGAAAVARALETALRDNVHYAYCRRLDQLGAVRVERVAGAARRYLEACGARGQRAGDVKPVALHAGDGWPQAFSGGITGGASAV